MPGCARSPSFSIYCPASPFWAGGRRKPRGEVGTGAVRSVPRCVSTSRACAWLRALFFTPDPRQMGRAVPLGEGRFLAPLFPSHRPPPVLVGARASPVGPSTRLCAAGTALQRSLLAQRDSGRCFCCHYAAPCDAGRVSELVMSSQGGLQGCKGLAEDWGRQHRDARSVRRCLEARSGLSCIPSAPGSPTGYKPHLSEASCQLFMFKAVCFEGRKMI